MANYALLKAAVQSVVKTNGNEEITGANLQSTLISIINSFGDGYIFKGVATTSTSAGTPDQREFYIAGAGTYANFNNVIVRENQIGVFYYDGQWNFSSVGDFSSFNSAQRALSLAWFETYQDVPNANGYINTSGIVAGITTARYTNYIAIKPNTEYIVRKPFVAELAAVALYNADKVFVRALQGTLTDDGDLIFTSQVNEHYLRASFTNSSFPKYVSVEGVSLVEGMELSDGAINTANIAANAVTSSKLSSDVRNLFSVYQVTLDNVVEGYIHSAGTVVQQSGYYATGYLPVKKGISVNIYNPFIIQAASVALYDENKTFVRSITSTQLGEYPKVAVIEPSDGEYYLRVSFSQNNIPNYIILSTDKSMSYDAVYTSKQLIAGGYIGTTGSVIPIQHTFSYCDYLELPTDIKFKVVNETLQAASFAIYNADKSVSRVILSGDVSGQAYIEFTLTDNEKYIRASFRTETSCNVMFAEVFTKLDIFKYKNNDKVNEVANILAAFDNIVCVGDSLTYSQVYTSASASRQARRTYPFILGKLCGNEVTTFASSGASAKAGWESFGSQITAKTNALAIIYLGTNEGLTDTLDTDVVGDNPDNWADNNTGCYCRFVQKFQSLGYKVLLLKCWASSGNLQNTNSAIMNIGQRFGCAVLDTPVSKSLKYHYYPDLSGSNYVHYNDLGYSWFASSLIVSASNMDDSEMKYIIPTA